MDNDKLEKFYNLGLEQEKLGNLDEAVLAYQQALLIDPDDHGGVKVRLASMGRGEVPAIAPRAYVTTLFDQTANMFDYILVDQLGYDVPLQLREIMLEILPNLKFDKMLDLGCGTGLSADAMDDFSNHKTGVDLSENMIEIASEKGDYDQLFVGDVVDFVTKSQDKWDFIVATDVLPYMGDIAAFIAGVAKCLSDDGIFGFSSETLPEIEFNELDYKVGIYQRFSHNEKYIHQLLIDNDLNCLKTKNIIVRNEQGKPVLGQLFIAQKNLSEKV